VSRKLPEGSYERLAWLLLLTTIPAVIFGKVFNDTIETHFSALSIIALNLILFALLLWVADLCPQKHKLENLGWFGALIIGIAQTLALFPGVSRSGITLTAGRALGFNREAAARYSFLASIPIVAGAALYEGLKLIKHHNTEAFNFLPFLLGIISAALAGTFVIKFFLNFIQKHNFKVFIFYRIILGLAIFVLACR
jgi:undecaprenyl-diphosphatase